MVNGTVAIHTPTLAADIQGGVSGPFPPHGSPGEPVPSNFGYGTRCNMKRNCINVTHTPLLAAPLAFPRLP